jgi:hypothetical protein
MAIILLRIRYILDYNVLICRDSEDITFVASMNHRPKVWTIHALNLKWPQCDYPHAQLGIIYKHIMKMFKVLHLDVHDCEIVQDVVTYHVVHQLITNLLGSRDGLVFEKQNKDVVL